LSGAITAQSPFRHTQFINTQSRQRTSHLDNDNDYRSSVTRSRGHPACHRTRSTPCCKKRQAPYEYHKCLNLLHLSVTIDPSRRLYRRPSQRPGRIGTRKKETGQPNLLCHAKMQLSLPIGTCCGRLPRQMVRWLPEDVGDLETLRDIEDYKNCLRTRSSFTSSIFPFNACWMPFAVPFFYHPPFPQIRYITAIHHPR